MATPEHIKKIIEDYKRPGENIVIIMPQVIKYHDQIYYGASYHQKRGEDATGFLILREDGNIPSKQEIIEVFFIVLSSSAIYSAVSRSAGELIRKKFMVIKWANKVLEKLEKKYDGAEEIKYIHSYRKTTESTLHNHQCYKEYALKQKTIINQIVDEGIVTPESYYESREVHLEMGRCLFFINYDQMQSYQDRVKAIKFLFKKGDIFRALGLFFVHLQLHPPYVKARNREDFEFTKTRYIDHKVPKEEIEILEKSISELRNPNLPGSEEDPRNLAINFLKTLDEPLEDEE
ncbi:MAG: hypothetical protein WB502_09280 [Thermoactinomyces sp.]